MPVLFLFQMIMGDIVRFLFVYIVFLLGFSIGNHNLQYNLCKTLTRLDTKISIAKFPSVPSYCGAKSTSQISVKESGTSL